MHQQIKDKLHYYVTHGLKSKYIHSSRAVLISGIESGRHIIIKGAFTDEAEFNELRPFMRPLSSLTKEITVDGYNDGKLFVPVWELQKHYGITTGKKFEISDYNNIDISLLPFKCYELLFRWHFWLWNQELFTTGDIIEIKD